MNKGLLIVLLWCITCAIPAMAQEVIYSPYDKFDFRTGEFSVSGMTGNRLYTYRGSSEGYFLDAFNDSMNKVATIVLDFFPAKIYQTRFIAYPDQIIVLYQAIEMNKVVQYAALLDEAGRLVKGPIQLDNTKTGILGPTKNYFSVAASEDKKTIFVYSAKDKGRELQLTGKWIDDKLNITGRTRAVFKTDNEVMHGELMVGNDSNVYVPVKTPVGSKSYGDQLWLLTLVKGTNKFTSKELGLNSNYAGNVYMKVDNANRRIYTGGFYSAKKNGSYDGVMYAYYDINAGNFYNARYIPFDEQMIQATGDKGKRRVFDDFQVRQMIVKNDGGFVLVSESYFIATRNSYTPGFGYYSMYYSPYMNASITEYYYNDIMALSYNADGVKEWSTIIPKAQYSQEDAGLFSSYALLNSGGTLAFLYNDFNVSQSRIQLATLSPAGKVNMHSFSIAGNEYPDWLPRWGKQVAARAMVVPCLRKKQICFAKIIF